MYQIIHDLEFAKAKTLSIIVALFFVKIRVLFLSYSQKTMIMKITFYCAINST